MKLFRYMLWASLVWMVGAILTGLPTACAVIPALVMIGVLLGVGAWAVFHYAKELEKGGL